jgi:hypothetical protein
MVLGSRARPVSRVDNLTDIYETIDCLDNEGSLKPHNPIGLHGLAAAIVLFFYFTPHT